jgi:hypothetical protein
VATAPSSSVREDHIPLSSLRREKASKNPRQQNAVNLSVEIFHFIAVADLEIHIYT